MHMLIKAISKLILKQDILPFKLLLSYEWQVVRSTSEINAVVMPPLKKK